MFYFIKMWLLEHFNITPVWKSLSRVRLFATPRDYTVHGSLQARTLEWAAIPFSGGSSQPRDQTQVSPIAGGFFTSWAAREALITTHVALTVFLHGLCSVPSWLVSMKHHNLLNQHRQEATLGKGENVLASSLPVSSFKYCLIPQYLAYNSSSQILFVELFPSSIPYFRAVLSYKNFTAQSPFSVRYLAF